MSIYRLIKRAIDLAASISILLVFSPILVLASAGILMLEGRPVFYISRRHVAVNRTIPVLKFRTMVRDAKSPVYNLHERFMQDGYLDIPVTCEVYTGIGRVLERSQLVELLQLVNVLLHGMSLIGNRPLPADNVEQLKKFPGWQERFGSPAGMTGISQIVGKFNLQSHERLELERLYSKVYQRGNVLKCDIEIAFYTVRLIVSGKTISLDYARDMLEACL